MASVDPLIPFLLAWECGLRRDDLRQPTQVMFQRARARGWSDDPDDRGGKTMCGVTLAAFAAWRKARGLPRPSAADLRAISYDSWRSVLKSSYWDALRCDSFGCQRLAELVADWGWASGPGTAAKALQRRLGVAPDGKVGPATLASLEAVPDARALFEAVKDDRRRFVKDICRARPSQRKFRRGWLRRIEAIGWEGLDYGL